MKEMDQYLILVKQTPSSPVSNPPTNSSQSDSIQLKFPPKPTLSCV